HRDLERRVALAVEERGGAGEGLGDLADVHRQEEQRDEQRGDGGLGHADHLAHRAPAEEGDLGHAAAAGSSSPSRRRPVAWRKTSSSVGRATEMEPTDTPVRSSPRTISAIEAGPSSTYRASASCSTITRSSPGSSPIAACVAAGSAPFRPTDTTSCPMRPLSSSGEPSATIRPSSMIARRRQSWSASSMYWVVRTIVVPPALMRR